MVLKRLDLTKMAVDVLVEAVSKQPLHWGAWQELATLITDREMVSAGSHEYHGRLWAHQCVYAVGGR